MKKSLKLLAATCASVMALSGVFTAGALATDTQAVEEMTSYEYLLSKVPYATPLGDGSYFIPGYGTVSRDMYFMLLNAYNNLYGPTLPNYPQFPLPDTDAENSPFQSVSVTMNQYDRQNIGFGTSYNYNTTDSTVATVDTYGNVYALAPGEATITVSYGYMTYMIYKVTVVAVDVDDANLSIKIAATDPYLTVGESTSVYAYVLKDGVNLAALTEKLTLSVSDTSVLGLDGATVTGIAPGTAEVTATLPDSELSASVTVQVMAPITTPTYPSYPDYPWIWNPTYPSLPSYPTYPNYPWYEGGTGNWEVTTPGSSTVSLTYYVTKLLDVDTDRFSVQARNYYLGGAWTKAYIIVPHDDVKVDITGYEVMYQNYYLGGSFSRLLILVPQGVDFTNDAEPEVEVPETPVKPAEPELTPEEIEELKKQEEEAKRLAELQKNVALALEGKMEWYRVYGDIYGDSYYSSAVKFVLDNQYLVGKNDGMFGASDATTYADVKEMLQKYLQMTSEEFDALGILTFTDGTKTISRQDLVTVFYKLAQHLKVEFTKTTSLDAFDDADEVTKENRDTYAWGIANKFVNKVKNEVNPNGTVEKTRLAQMLYLVDRKVK